MHKVFVYGTLRSEAARPAEKFVDAKVLSRATVPGHIYDLGWFPGFKHGSTLDSPHNVVGELIEVTDEALERLDAYEGVPDLYKRESTTALTYDGEYVPCFVYVYNGQVHNNDFVPHGDWVVYAKEEA